MMKKQVSNVVTNQLVNVFNVLIDHNSLSFQSHERVITSHGVSVGFQDWAEVFKYENSGDPVESYTQRNARDIFRTIHRAWKLTPKAFHKQLRKTRHISERKSFQRNKSDGENDKR